MGFPFSWQHVLCFVLLNMFKLKRAFLCMYIVTLPIYNVRTAYR